LKDTSPPDHPKIFSRMGNLYKKLVSKSTSLFSNIVTGNDETYAAITLLPFQSLILPEIFFGQLSFSDVDDITITGDEITR
jgi:hypothetical protein